MNRITYTVKAFALLIVRVAKKKEMPYHSKNGKHDGIVATAKGILKGECRLHWLRN